MNLPLAEIAQQATVRLIPTCYYKPPVLRALVDSDQDVEVLAALEGLTSGRLKAVRSGKGGVLREETIPPSVWGSSYVNAAFSYTRRGGNRFNGEDRGAWYASFNDRTAIEEVAFHKTRELGYINKFEEECIYQSLLASFIGKFHDLRSIQSHESLHSDTNIGYPAGQALAKELIKHQSRGLLYPSVRHPSGTCLVAFQPNTIQDIRPGSRWKLTWSGSEKFQIAQDDS